MSMKIILNLMFKELRVYYKDYKEEILPRPDGYIHEFSKNEKSIKIIFDQVNFKILNISENIEALSGYKVESLRNKTAFPFLNVVAFEHILFPYIWLRWINQMCAQYGISVIKEGATAIF